MARELVKSKASVRRAEPLSAPYWTRLSHVRVPDGQDCIDLVLVGPSGVHVVIDRPAPLDDLAATGGTDAELEDLAQRAISAAEAVVERLPVRYRPVVTAEVSLAGLTETALGFGVALVASPDVLQHVWQHRPQTLSTSEAAAVTRLLRDRLEPFPVQTTQRPASWWRSRRWMITAAAAATGVAAGVAAAVTVGMPPL